MNWHYLKKLISWLLPPVCILCQRPTFRDIHLCYPCHQELPRITLSCPLCGRPLAKSNTCGTCLQNKPSFDRTFVLFYYASPITQLIMSLKFGHALVNANVFGQLLAEEIKQNWYQARQWPEVIIPIPLHFKRLKERGFNQAIEIARPLSKILSLPLSLTECRRTKSTEAQATLSAKNRISNIQNAFEVPLLTYRHVAVLDDVITTGNTIEEFCKALKRSGVQEIDVWCCARPIM